MEYKTIINTFIEHNKVLFIIGVQAPFWLKTFINSAIANERDKTEYFILFLNPFSQDAREHGLECMLRFYWKPIDNSIPAKRTVNVLSLIFGLFILGTFLMGTSV
jgi:hypothetical protein